MTMPNAESPHFCRSELVMSFTKLMSDVEAEVRIASTQKAAAFCKLLKHEQVDVFQVSKHHWRLSWHNLYFSLTRISKILQGFSWCQRFSKRTQATADLSVRALDSRTVADLEGHLTMHQGLSS